jgi:hypothetical protein
MAKFKEARRKNGIQNKHSNSQKRSDRKTKSFLGQICYKSRTRHIKDPTQSVQNFKTNKQRHKRNSKIQGNVDENVFLQCYETLGTTTNTNDPEIVWNSII